MNIIVSYFEDILSISKSAKFWIGLAGAVASYLAVTLGDTQLGSLAIGLAAALGIYATPNNK